MLEVQTPADRYIEAQAWWIASELARRTPKLRIAETDHDEVGSSLSVYDPDGPIETQVILNRIAGINIAGDPFFHLEWPEIFAAPSPHEVVKRVETGLMLTPPSPAPPTNTRTIVYRTIAHILATVLNDRRSWTIRGQRPTDPSVHSEINWAGDTSHLHSIENLIGRWFSDEHTGVLEEQGVTHLWALWRDLEPIAVFDMYGDIHTTRGQTSLLPMYRREHNMGRTVQAVLGHELP
jgi:hypothetical protein